VENGGEPEVACPETEEGEEKADRAEPQEGLPTWTVVAREERDGDRQGYRQAEGCP